MSAFDTPLSYIGGYVDRNSVEPSNGFDLGGNAATKTVPGLTYVIDPTLPVISRHPSDQELVVIPKGTICAINSTALTNSPATLTICGDSDAPIGVAPGNIKRQDPNLMKWEQIAPIRDRYITLPYIEAVHGTDLTNGCLVKSGASGVIDLYVDASHADKTVLGRLEVLDKRGGNSPGWLKWVQTNFSQWAYGIAFPQGVLRNVTRDGNSRAAVVATTSTIGLTPASSLGANLTNTVYHMTYDKIVPNRPIHVIVAGVTLAKNDIAGVSGYGQGYDYTVNWDTGDIYFTSAQATTTTVQATYAYEPDSTLGFGFAQGVLGLTDGQNSGLGAGVLPWHDVTGAVGYMLIRVY